MLRVCVCVSICPSSGAIHINFQQKEALTINCNCTTHIVWHISVTGIVKASTISADLAIDLNHQLKSVSVFESLLRPQNLLRTEKGLMNSSELMN